ncbi:uncharacterized protein F5Z01DRAFT_631954 [Emericellopsis atlantica]|uniref:Histone deacetylase complex subunit SAP30 Sin3 binding domain-containing protein n=1 Tax=Emericellopsis atlantica TaxID=2614577 RepID=A0A9P7ZV08_9HYPO|nr:uncharacterized protein F5Z01DRAFT_631954 [Emericellopsis atlantica]KAG9258859.1 hypothetical protein F5Z01DRAFT_631954 [Emericellopsis atlantica]
MPPAKSARKDADDGKADTPTGNGKNGNATSAKMRRITSQQGGSQLREVTNASATSAPMAQTTEATAPSINWASLSRETLHTYARQHALQTPSSYTSSFHRTVLSSPIGIGKYSPTMRKNQRQTRENLTRTVRKHFNGMGVQENDVIVDFIYKIRSEDAAKARGPQKTSIVTE